MNLESTRFHDLGPNGRRRMKRLNQLFGLKAVFFGLHRCKHQVLKVALDAWRRRCVYIQGSAASNEVFARSSQEGGSSVQPENGGQHRRGESEMGSSGAVERNRANASSRDAEMHAQRHRGQCHFCADFLKSIPSCTDRNHSIAPFVVSGEIEVILPEPAFIHFRFAEEVGFPRVLECAEAHGGGRQGCRPPIEPSLGKKLSDRFPWSHHRCSDDDAAAAGNGRGDERVPVEFFHSRPAQVPFGDCSRHGANCHGK